MNHRQTIDRFLAYLEGRLSRLDRAGVEHHLATCPSCRASYALLQRATADAAPAPDLRPDPYLPARIRARVAESVRAGDRVWMPALRLSAISLGLGVAVVIGIVLGHGLSQTTAATTTTDDVVSVFASSIIAADPGDQWSSAVGNNAGERP